MDCCIVQDGERGVGDKAVGKRDLMCYLACCRVLPFLEGGFFFADFSFEVVEHFFGLPLLEALASAAAEPCFLLLGARPGRRAVGDAGALVFLGDDGDFFFVGARPLAAPCEFLLGPYCVSVQP